MKHFTQEAKVLRLKPSTLLPSNHAPCPLPFDFMPHPEVEEAVYLSSVYLLDQNLTSVLRSRKRNKSKTKINKGVDSPPPLQGLSVSSALREAAAENQGHNRTSSPRPCFFLDAS